MKGCNQHPMMVRLNKKAEILVISLALEGKVSRTLKCVFGGWLVGMVVTRNMLCCISIVFRLLMLLLML